MWGGAPLIVEGMYPGRSLSFGVRPYNHAERIVLFFDYSGDCLVRLLEQKFVGNEVRKIDDLRAHHLHHTVEVGSTQTDRARHLDLPVHKKRVLQVESPDDASDEGGASPFSQTH